MFFIESSTCNFFYFIMQYKVGWKIRIAINHLTVIWLLVIFFLPSGPNPEREISLPTTSTTSVCSPTNILYCCCRVLCLAALGRMEELLENRIGIPESDMEEEGSYSNGWGLP